MTAGVRSAGFSIAVEVLVWSMTAAPVFIALPLARMHGVAGVGGHACALAVLRREHGGLLRVAAHAQLLSRAPSEHIAEPPEERRVGFVQSPYNGVAHVRGVLCASG